MSRLSVKMPVVLPAQKERRRLRVAAGLSGAALAADIGVSPASVYGWETSGREPKGLLREAYARALQELARAERAEDELQWTPGF
jgi:transcriptional regulator with XRE-family HTH domain